MSDIIMREEMKLIKGYSEMIKEHHRAAGEALSDALANAEKVGELLEKVKSELPYGEFGEWVNMNLPFNMRTAQRYMSLYAHSAELSLLEPSSLSEAYKLIEKKKEETVVDDFSGEFSEEEDDDEVINVEVKPTLNSNFDYWYSFEKIVKLMDAEYLKLASKRDHTMPKALGHAIGNIKEMSLRIAAWNPVELFDCPACGGSKQITDENGQMTTCQICVDGLVGPFKESKY